VGGVPINEVCNVGFKSHIQEADLIDRGTIVGNCVAVLNRNTIIAKSDAVEEVIGGGCMRDGRANTREGLGGEIENFAIGHGKLSENKLILSKGTSLVAENILDKAELLVK
jgi:hypothetical protein